MKASPLARTATSGTCPLPGRTLGITMLLGWNGVGGTQRQALKLSEALTSLGIDVSVITRLEPGLARRERMNRVCIHRVGWSSSRRGGPLSLLLGSLLWTVRHRQAFQVLHAHTLPAALTAVLLRPVLRKPVIAKLPNPRTLDEFSRRRFGTLRWFLIRRYVTCFVALNDEIEGQLRAKGVAAARIVRIPNGVEPCTSQAGAADPVATRPGLGFGPESRVVIYLGRLIEAKGLRWLLGIWKDIVDEEGACRLLMVGGGPDEPGLRELAQSLGIAGSVAFLGQRDDVRRLLSIADILVLPSRSEGMSNAVLEGMAHGLAVIATDVPGNRAVIDDGVHGLLVPYGDSGALKQALLHLLRDRELRRRLGREARQRAESTLSISAVARQYDTIYRQLVPR